VEEHSHTTTRGEISSEEAEQLPEVAVLPNVTNHSTTIYSLFFCVNLLRELFRHPVNMNGLTPSLCLEEHDRTKTMEATAAHPGLLAGQTVR